MHYTVRNATATPGWIVHLGLRVSCRPVRFGQTSYLIKDGSDHIELVQAPARGRKLTIPNPSAGQKVILERLVEAGVLVDHGAPRGTHQIVEENKYD